MTRTVPHRGLVMETRPRAIIALALMIGFITVIGASSAQAQKYDETILYSFAGGFGHGNPEAGLISDAQGNLYGTTEYGGASNAGSVFKVSGKGKETILYSFTGGGDGAYPWANLIFDAKGNLYGTTEYGGASGYGTVFKLSKSGKETVLHSFTDYLDGAQPIAGLIWDMEGNLYGTTTQGEVFGGVVFKVTKTGKETVLYPFPEPGDPQGRVIMDAKGNLYGTTVFGGTFGNGSVFKIDKAGKATVLYSFTGGDDGGGPVAGLTLDAKGNLYGTTYAGGASGYGTVFELNKKGVEILHTFTDGADGGRPAGGLIFDVKGNLYGTTYLGGTYPCLGKGCGTVFKLDTTGRETVLHSFNGEDGFGPMGSLIMDAKGSLYGVTSDGGTSDAGVVFKLSESGQGGISTRRETCAAPFREETLPTPE